MAAFTRWKVTRQGGRNGARDYRPGLLRICAIRGAIEIARTPVSDQAFRFTVRILNLTDIAGPESSMLAAHTMVVVQNATLERGLSWRGAKVSTP